MGDPHYGVSKSQPKTIFVNMSGN